MSDSLLYKISSGKPPKFLFFIKGFFKQCVPGWYYRHKRNKIIHNLQQRKDKDYILERVAYYNKTNKKQQLPQEAINNHNGSYYIFVDKMKNFGPSTFHKAYFFDLYDVTRYFDRSQRIAFIPGDVYFTPQYPSIVKSRLLKDDNQNSVILKLDKLRHFMFVNDKKMFTNKLNLVMVNNMQKTMLQNQEQVNITQDLQLM